MAAKKKTTKKTKAKAERGTKQAEIIRLMCRSSGATRQQLLDSTEKGGGSRWKAINIFTQAKAAGIKVKKVKEDGRFVYYGSAKASRSKAKPEAAQAAA